MKDGGSHRHGTGGHGHQEKGEKNRDYPFKLIFSIIEQGDSTVNLEVTVAWSKVKNFFLKSTSNFGHCSRQSTKSTSNECCICKAKKFASNKPQETESVIEPF